MQWNCRRSSGVEQRFRKARVGGSNPFVGFKLAKGFERGAMCPFDQGDVPVAHCDTTHMADARPESERSEDGGGQIPSSAFCFALRQLRFRWGFAGTLFCYARYEVEIFLRSPTGIFLGGGRRRTKLYHRFSCCRAKKTSRRL